MERSIFFGRHGLCDAGGLGDEGLVELAILRESLATRGFKPKRGVASPTLRTIHTARFLLHGVEPQSLSFLHASGSIQDIDVAPAIQGGPVTTFEAHEYAERALQDVLPLTGREDAIVISHDHIPLLLAWRYMELHGRTFAWSREEAPDYPAFPDQGEGLLVQGTEYEIFKRP